MKWQSVEHVVRPAAPCSNTGRRSTVTLKRGETVRLPWHADRPYSARCTCAHRSATQSNNAAGGNMRNTPDTHTNRQDGSTPRGRTSAGRTLSGALGPSGPPPPTAGKRPLGSPRRSEGWAQTAGANAGATVGMRIEWQFKVSVARKCVACDALWVPPMHSVRGSVCVALGLHRLAGFARTAGTTGSL